MKKKFITSGPVIRTSNVEKGGTCTFKRCTIVKILKTKITAESLHYRYWPDGVDVRSRITFRKTFITYINILKITNIIPIIWIYSPKCVSNVFMMKKIRLLIKYNKLANIETLKKIKPLDLPIIRMNF